MDIITALAKELSQAKTNEVAAKAERLRLETQLIEAIGSKKLEGATAIVTDYHKIIVTAKLTRKLDEEAWAAIAPTDRDNFIDLKPVINLQRLREVEARNPQLVASLVTTKPAKTSIKIEEI